MLKIGLTGGIGSGKSTVSTIFASLGVPIIDSDVIAREVVAPGEQGLEQIVARFGKDTLNPDGTLDRQHLRTLVFADTNARKDLEQILHPLIRNRSNAYLAEIDAPYAILSIPLLIETELNVTVDRVLVVDCQEQTQIERICQRDGVTSEQAKAIMATQCSRDRRLAAADDVIENSHPIEELRCQIESLHNSYLSLVQQTQESPSP